MTGLPALEDFMEYYKQCGKQVDMSNYNRCRKCPLHSRREVLTLFIVSLLNFPKDLWSVPATFCSMLRLK
jgi:hypothetical protein